MRQRLLSGFAVFAVVSAGGVFAQPQGREASVRRPACQATTQPTGQLSSLATGYETMLRDLEFHFWDSRGRPAHIRPTNGANPDVGQVNPHGARPSFWQMASYANVLYWDFILTRSQAARQKMKSQWDYIGTFWTHRQLATANAASGTMNASDDAALVLAYLLQVHEVTGDRNALADAVSLLASILDRWADPGAPRTSHGSLRASPYGILYATADGDPDHQQVSTIFESMIANAALDLYCRTENPDNLAYAKATFDWSRRYLKQTSTGLYFIELDLRTQNPDGSPNSHHLKPIGDYFGPPVRGIDATYMAGTMSMGVLASRLYKITGEAAYLDEARSTASAIVKINGYLRAGNLFVNSRDPWTDGYMAPQFADEVLTLAGADPTGLMKASMVSTAKAIIAQRTSDGYYGADWSGPERNPINDTTNWVEDSSRRSGSGAGQALPRQIMTSATSAAMVQGGLYAEALLRRGSNMSPR